MLIIYYLQPQISEVQYLADTQTQLHSLILRAFLLSILILANSAVKAQQKLKQSTFAHKLPFR